MPEPPDKLPSLGKRAKNFAGAVGRVGKASVSGRPVLVRNAERDRRISVCESNKCGAYNKEKGACNWCGCFIKEKARWATEECGEMEVAKEKDTEGKDWWTGETRGAPVQKVSRPAPAPPKATRQVAAGNNSLYVTGKQMLENEARLRMVLPVKGELVKRFNEYHAAVNDPKGCTNCRKNSFLRSFEMALSYDFKSEGVELIQKVREMFPSSKYISAPSPTNWDVILKR